MSNVAETAHSALLPQGAAYGLLIGLSILFCGIILLSVKIQKDYLAEDSGESEMFMVANRSVGTGLTASAVTSSWIWLNESVLAAAMCYNYGIALPVWWGSGLCFQVALMAVLGVIAKIRVPFAHTSLEIVRQRYRNVGHVVYIVLNLVNNVFGCASMIMVGSQLIHGVSGMHFVAATVLIPLEVVLYTAVGGLKATFLTDFLHTTVVLILIIYFTITVLVHPEVGGLYGLYDKLVATASENYIPGNYEGSVLTFKSKGAIIWGLVLKFGNLALVVMDTAFWQKSFATEVKATVPGYNIAAIAVFGVPWGIGTVIGLTARALHNTPIFPVHSLTQTEINLGMVMPYTLKALIGDRGPIAFFFLVFMTLTSTISSSMIAVSSILSYDIYKTYLNPRVGDKGLVRVSHISVILHGVFITVIAIILQYGGANMTWINYLRPIISCPGIIPLVLTLFWSRQTRLAAILSPILGFFSGLAVWLATTKSMYGSISITTTSNEYPALEFLRIELADEQQLHGHVSSSTTPGELVPSAEWGDPESTKGLAEKGLQAEVSSLPARPMSLDDIQHPFDEATLKELHRWLKIAVVTFIVLVLVTFILWPMPLYRDYIFSKSFFSGWVTVAIIYQFLAFFAVVVFPLYDGRHEIARGATGAWNSLMGYFGRKSS
ncbi:hypothetical protein N7468_010429 [Penicillium chermesinum]|uniref:Sodium/solute symporter n=1 Tax=Penicillium chermesinum TaxID=63820 RepID=A0A9W9NCN7_9EURO|nr:uncharacterized protein N7468_010429 [Penicillium chermesinum]KAJ5217421.1 hypothetical protein N7468_010429 [Penicillium chermesinum]